MKATGIIRRIDELGRIVLPKELRRQRNLNEGDPMEIFVTEDCIALKKYMIDYTAQITSTIELIQEDPDITEEQRRNSIELLNRALKVIKKKEGSK